MDNSTRPVIFIICDQLCAVQDLPPDVRKNFKGYKKWSERCVNLMKNFVTSIPCSPSRATIYTGKDSNTTQITDNNNNSWQRNLATVAEGIKTLGTYFKDKGYKTRYIGKFHLTKELDRQLVLKFKPTVATQDYLKPYDFDIYDKQGDAGYRVSGGFFSDVEILEKLLPNGNDTHKCDYYDKETKTAHDGVFPYLVKRYEDQDNKFLLVINFRNPHDVTYNDTITKEDNPTSETPTLQFSGNPEENYRTNSSYNKNYRLFYETPLINYESITKDNAIDSETNDDPLYIGTAYYLASKYYAYGISKDNLLSYKYYQTNYLQVIKQLDTQLEQLYDFLEKYNYFNTAVIILGSDHGEMNGSHGLIGKGNMLYESAWKVTTLISTPDMPTSYKGKKHNKVTSNIQLTPTAMMLSKLYDECDINKLDLYSSIFKKCKNNTFKLHNSDFKNLKANFSVGYGAIFLPLLRAIRSPTLDEELNLFIPIQMNYFTIPSLTIGADIRYNGKLYNVGYYFSIFHLFLSNYGRIINPDIIPTIPDLLIMTNSVNSGGIAFVGTPLQIYQQFFGNVYFVTQYFQNVKIEPFVAPLTTEYKPLLLPPSIYGTSVYTNTDIFNEQIVLDFINSLEPAVIPEPTSTLYDSGVESNGTPGGIYCFYGSTEYIQFMFETDPVLNKWTQPTIVSGKLPQYDIYVMNDPIYQQAQIYTKVDSDIPTIIDELNLIDYIKLLFTLPLQQIAAIIIVNIKYSVFDSAQYIFSHYLELFSTFILPGQDMDVQSLLSSGFQVQVYDDTQDPQELYNLADSSRLAENLDLVNHLLVELNKHIKYHNNENIYISLPRQLLFTEILEKTKNFVQRETPLIYNYSLLEANYYNITEG